MSTPAFPADPAEIERALRLLVEPGETFEIRCPNTARGVVSGYFNEYAPAVKAAAQWSGRAESVYVTLNSVLPDLRARSNNRVKEYVQTGLTTADKHILWRRWWLVDCDPQRPKGISATETEHAASHARALAVRDWLAEELGFPAPVVADSGNGAHLLYRVDLPNTERAKACLQAALQALAARFNDAAVEVDVSTFNAARVVKLYGTLAAKGDHCPELGRPHRVARLLEVPEPVAVVDFGAEVLGE